MTTLRSSIYLLVLAIGPSATTYGAGIYSGTITGVFTNPVLSGYFLDLTHTPVFQDNTTSAVYSGIGTNTIQSGANPTPGNVSPFSELIFTGSTVSAEPANTPFTIGTISFLNGTSDTTTIIFGATLSLSFNGNGGVTPGVLKVTLVGTQNGNVDPYADADYLGLSSITPGPAIPTTFNVFEGKQSTVTLIGSFVGDPQLTVTGLSLPAGDPNGFLAQGQGSSVPEPASWLTMGASLAGAFAYAKLKAARSGSNR